MGREINHFNALRYAIVIQYTIEVCSLWAQYARLLPPLRIASKKPLLSVIEIPTSLVLN